MGEEGEDVDCEEEFYGEVLNISVELKGGWMDGVGRIKGKRPRD